MEQNRFASGMFKVDCGFIYPILDAGKQPKVNSLLTERGAHQDKELADAALARNALQEWATGLCQIWKLHKQ
jgi:hypothetical protein